ncbi:BAD_collapsed_G0000470.mRNA.1.CDS.1 [Saccharomyces cerevisiae]|nr:BAD_HP_G0015300.mRNA.1.CDS.1 [Saccharomyces cerevisiae]CAI4994709.1 BAD_HP_G0061690.mRNA.1.CDS.1 [Saccharomyces cerevisiae]CAI6475552.1 BAD_HP_G0015300.mRNA.1.CDS.1 [Saccharomyces cerevisiae]CAI6880234.1 BAD_HP_G0061690.mRNA.1.CDS.1 [Saccharomyces cerevisiae]CAI7126048.1 BAD_collapsed_G0000470.mRNA.1.CDS.1 [Saccharomyces cerevisiae]
MEIFSQKDYYPTPSSNVISYESDCLSKPVNSADLPALIVHLSSPLEGVDYNASADFFLIYRNFITPQDLHDLLIYRFRWCIREITTNAAKAKRRRIGEVALVRTFVLLRHSILNYFVQDFLPNITLRLRLIEFLNDKHIEQYPKIISSCIINLKKNWVHCSKLVWENIELNEPDKLDFDAWLHYSLKDFTQLESLHKRGSRLSIYARQSFASPDFRNQSVLSLYKTSDVFRLPEKLQSSNSSKNQRSPSMLLFPDNTSNVYSKHRIAKEPSVDNESQDMSDSKQKISHLSKVTLVSTLMKGVDYPSSYAVDKIMPPTPAKKVEFILNSLYIPEDLNEQSGTLQGTSTTSSLDNNSNSNSRSNTSSMSVLHRSAIGLLAKWMKNHNRHDSSNDKKFMSAIKPANQKPEMDAFVKYVVSISSLNRKSSKEEEEEFLNSDSSKFDILSARTIDEVESLLHLQNQLIEKVQTHSNNNRGPTVNVDCERREHIHDIKILQQNSFKPSNDNFSAMDNLDLYQTVSSIAQSVISLTNTLNKQLQNNESNMQPSPSYDALQRRKVKSLTTAYYNKMHGSYSAESMRLFDKDNSSSRTDENGPQRLLFHETDKTNSEAIPNMTPRRKNHSQSQKSMTSSPLKNVLPDLKESSPLNDSREDTESITYSYDSELSSSSPPRDTVTKKSRKVRNIVNNTDSPTLKTKTGFLNLREFTFEDTKSLDEKKGTIDGLEKNYDNKENQESEYESTKKLDNSLDASSEANNYDITTRKKHSSCNHKIKQAVVRPASGRISISRVQSIAITPTKELSIVDPEQNKSNSVIEEISEIEPLNLEYNKKSALYSDTSSTVISISTSKLFESAQNSPIKQTQNPQREFPNGTSVSETNRIRLSIAPTIESVVSDLNSITTGSTVETFETSRDSPVPHQRIINLREEYQRGNQDIISNTSSLHELKTIDLSDSNNDLESPSTHAKNNKYFFSPDDGSIDVASPMKNVEELKSKFLKNESETNSNISGSVLTMDDIDINDTSSVRNTRRANSESAFTGSLNKKNLNEIANMLDDSISDDPITVALMKLEGTYEKIPEKPENTKSSDAIGIKTSKLADEVEMLNLNNLPSFQNSPAEKRKSLLIERRRQTIMNIPFTPDQSEKEGFTSSSPEKIDVSANVDVAVQAAQIQELIGQYRIHDSRLMISNNESHVPFILMYDSLSVAQQMTLIEKEILGEIDWKDLLDLKMKHEGPQVISWLQLLVRNETLSGIDLAISRFNLTVDWIISEILLTKSSKMKRNVIQRFIHVADHCRTFQNFNTLMEIILALSSSVVQKFTDAWRLIEPGDLLTWEELKKIPSLDRNYSTIRNLLNSVNPLVGCVPFIVVYLSDLSANAEKKDWILEDKVVNYNKFDTNVQIVKNFIQRVQWSKFYTFKVNHELLSKCVYISTLTQEEINELST